jgi:anthranilate phosphoribosyltransferase
VNLQQAIAKLLRGHDLARGEAEAVMGAIADGEASPAQIGALLALVQQRGPTVDEIAGFATVLRQRAVHIRAAGGPLLDTCGTGGDGAGTLNVSTLAALVAAAAGVPVAKHGNRSVSGRVGSADLLEALGVRIELDVEAVEACLRDTGFAFLFAPRFHPAWRHVAAPRRELGVRTVFNVLGPLVSPAEATHQLLGVYDAALVPKLAEVLGALGTRRALVVHGEDGIDEISASGPTRVAELRDGRVRPGIWRPEDAGVAPSSPEALRGGGLAENVALARRVLDGEPGPLLDAVALNAGAALYVAEAAPDWWAGVRDARALLADGRVRAKLAQVVAHTGGRPP